MTLTPIKNKAALGECTLLAVVDYGRKQEETLFLGAPTLYHYSGRRIGP